MQSSSLDLHGVTHKKVEETLERFFFWDKPGYKNYTIITGDSYEMRRIVTKWLDKHEYYHYIPPHNNGEIRISE